MKQILIKLILVEKTHHINQVVELAVINESLQFKLNQLETPKIDPLLKSLLARLYLSIDKLCITRTPCMEILFHRLDILRRNKRQVIHPAQIGGEEIW